jgi:predicted DNA repair protein MutK
MLGGAYLCFEGFEKIAHKLLHSSAEDQQHHDQLAAAVADPAVDLVAMEQDKIQGAIRTDFILSAEIIVIALGTVAEASFGQQLTVMVGIAVAMTVGVYGIVAGIVKMDDAGLYLERRPGAGAFVRGLGGFLLAAAPKLMKFLSVAGTLAMFMVGGGILTHGLPGAYDLIHHAAEAAGGMPAIGPALQAVAPSLLDAVAGVVAGAIVLALVTLASRILRAFKG